MNFKDFIRNDNFNNGISLTPFIIAEAGVNHECDMDVAKRLINEAKEGGADAIKFQTYKAEKIASKHSPYYWDISKEPTKSQYKLFKKYDKFWKNEYEELKLICDNIDIEFMSTPFDFESANFLNDLMEVFKISSSDITNKPFIEYIANFQKPIILSTGASELDEIKRSINWLTTKSQIDTHCLMHCILNYPTSNENANLGMLIDLKANYPSFILGYSDHTLPDEMKILEIATLLGAKVIEKHFTHDKNLKGNDHYHAMDKNDLKIFRKNLDNLKKSIGSFEKFSLETEQISRKNARRSIVANEIIKKGEIITKDKITYKRPGTGIPPFEIDNILGKKASKEILEDCIIEWEHIDK